ncbi:hypothetical protein [Mesoplasma florum]|uniref:hypothetical protein n=1 Tax=Mesoplasma florum TaxID=2151 RepID=UPI000BE44DF5|nr:hypothetical protein [Mesoplasma florum]ATI72968.1 hypothetical protein CQZ69_00070 [Mesoplasma florum]AVN61371.1 hypothetical protein CG004_00070 [Mesoplasma florum]
MTVLEKLSSVSNELKNSSYKFIAIKIREKLSQGNFEWTQKDLADECFVSESTITKFSKYLGFSGFREFSFLLKKEIIDYKTPSKDFFVNDKNFFNPIFKWIESQSEFIAKLSLNILESEDFLILSSYQLSNSTDFLSNSINSLGIKTTKINFPFFNGFDFIKGDKQTIIIFLTGTDNESIVSNMHILKEKLNNNYSNVFVLTSEKQKIKIPTEFVNVINIDIVKNWPSFVQRNICVSILTGKIYLEILKNNSSKN